MDVNCNSGLDSGQDLDSSLGLEGDKPASTDIGVNMSGEEKKQQEMEWQEELSKTEDEVNTLNQVLIAKQHRANELKKLLGITKVTGIQKDVKDGFKNITESEVLQKTNQALKSAGEKTSAVFSNIRLRLSDVKLSIESKVEERLNHIKKSKSLFALQTESRVNTSKSDVVSPAIGEEPDATQEEPEEDISLYHELDDSHY